jgi:16S rRNA (guanine527-N7)-methyltransferase
MMRAEERVVGGVDVSRETLDTLKAFENQVRRWNAAINLVSKNSLDDLWSRHIADSAQIFRACPTIATTWVDLGSGGGFPGLVVAILAREAKPELNVTLVEADVRKATFLRQASQALGLNVTVLSARIESLSPQKADVLSARALASLSELLSYAESHLQPDGTAIFPKGARYAEELAQAREAWDFDVEAIPSASDKDAAVLVVRNIHRHV